MLSLQDLTTLDAEGKELEKSVLLGDEASFKLIFSGIQQIHEEWEFPSFTCLCATLIRSILYYVHSGGNSSFSCVWALRKCAGKQVSSPNSCSYVKEEAAATAPPDHEPFTSTGSGI